MGSLVGRKRALIFLVPHGQSTRLSYGALLQSFTVFVMTVFIQCVMSLSLSSDFGIAQIYGGLVVFLVSGFILDTDEKWWLQWFLRGLRWPAHD